MKSLILLLVCAVCLTGSILSAVIFYNTLVVGYILLALSLTMVALLTAYIVTKAMVKEDRHVATFDGPTINIRFPEKEKEVVHEL